ncbi:deaminase domain-containing protein [Litchfieldia alkalitelluris]|uniref:deaminase domain-containing protein n=1 Tax=Litchfieldia alkalitelluris TaxID=304268 RepID=UPI0009971FD2|nr:deaminase domain-containing protein [Litchfieldia alkalitelluris]
MGKVFITQLERTNDFTSFLQEMHLDFLEGIERESKTQMSDEFWDKMQNPNLAYLNFEGELDSRASSVTLLAHSGINYRKKGEPITNYLNYVYELEPKKPFYKSGFVNRFNDFCCFDINKVKEELIEDVWNRNVDSESKVLEKFLKLLNSGVNDVAGNLVIYTFYYPCLSCSNKIMKIINELSERYPKLDVDIWYVGKIWGSSVK